MELFEHIRRDQRERGASIRDLARRHRVHRRTVRQALRSALPPPRKPVAKAAPRLGPHRATIRAWLVADLNAPRKQRHTARRIGQRLVDERGASAFTVTGGEVDGIRRLVPGSNIGWEITVSADSSGDVTVTLPATEDCEAQGAICTDDGGMLSEGLELTVNGPVE